MDRTGMLFLNRMYLPLMSRFPLSLFVAISIFCVLDPGSLRAFDGPDAFAVNLPFAANAATPVWLGYPQVPATTFAALDLPIQPPDTTSSLLVTVFFQEKEGGFLRIMWQNGSQQAQLLSDNFYEGIGMGNQRSLLISPETLQGGGTLAFQCGDTTLGVQRIRLQWLENQNGLVSPEIQDTLVTPSLGTTKPAQVLDGQPKPGDSPTWYGRLVVVPITDAPQRIEQGVEYSVQLDGVPSAGRLILKEDGLAWGTHLVVWINQQRVGTIAPEVPDLADDGFWADVNSSNVYVGWRDGSFFLPVSSLKTGVNTVQFSVEDDESTVPSTGNAATALPLALKDVVMQLSYPTTESSVTPSAPTTPVEPPTTDILTPGASAVPAAIPPDSSTPSGPISNSSSPTSASTVTP
jgi:hypothetical protein